MKFDLHTLFSGKYAPWFSGALILFFSLLIIMEWSKLFMSPIKIETIPQVDKEIPLLKKQNSFPDVVHSSLFGVYVAKNLNESSVKKSLLNVTVVGILFAKNQANSQVIIRFANGEEKTYKLGDIIPGDALIKRITASGILVERHGTLESLSLPKNDLNFEPIAKPLQGE